MKYDLIGLLKSENKLIDNGENVFSTVYYEYDKFGSLIRETSAGGATAEYVYDKTERPVSIKDGNGRIIQYTYDFLGRVKTKTDGKMFCKQNNKYAATENTKDISSYF